MFLLGGLYTACMLFGFAHFSEFFSFFCLPIKKNKKNSQFLNLLVRTFDNNLRVHIDKSK